MNLIEQYQINEDGYHPFLIREGWQVAQLNFMPEQLISNITKLDVHHLTDEVFILLEGNAVLIGADLGDGGPYFEVQLMQPNITYNIPKGRWHNIAMQEGCKIIIVEKSDTHIADFEYYPLAEDTQKELRKMVNEQFQSVK